MRSIERAEAQTIRAGRSQWLDADTAGTAIGARVISLARVAAALHMAESVEVSAWTSEQSLAVAAQGQKLMERGSRNGVRP
jgi:hypothetical protein